MVVCEGKKIEFDCHRALRFEHIVSFRIHQHTFNNTHKQLHIWIQFSDNQKKNITIKPHIIPAPEPIFG